MASQLEKLEIVSIARDGAEQVGKRGHSVGGDGGMHGGGDGRRIVPLVYFVEGLTDCQEGH